MSKFKKTMSPAIFCVVLLIVVCFGFGIARPLSSPDINTHAAEVVPAPVSPNTAIYDQLGLNKLGLSRDAFTYAMEGFNRLAAEGKILNDNILSIIDFSLPSSQKRLFVIDIKTGELIYNTLVAHGRGSGKETATQFSNQPNSFQSSLGFYITGDIYNGKHGCSLRLEGEEKGINDNALERGIVMHSATYVDESLIHSQGYIGRSQGCPAVPEKLHKQIIDKIKNGSCLFMYSPDQNYIRRSKMLADRA